MFYEIFLKLCNSKAQSPNAVAKELGFSTGTVTWWKKGRAPRDTALQKIADYFGVSVDYLLGKEEPLTPSACNVQLSAHEYQVITAYRQKPEMQHAVDRLLEISEITRTNSN